MSVTNNPRPENAGRSNIGPFFGRVLYSFFSNKITTLYSQTSNLGTFIFGQGEDATEFKVHKEHVVFHSDVLVIAFSSDFMEDHTHKISKWLKCGCSPRVISHS